MILWTRYLAAIAALTALLPAARAADPARDYPNRPVRIITGSPGITSDIDPRFVGQRLTERACQQSRIDNRPGAGVINRTQNDPAAPAERETWTVGHIRRHAHAQGLL